MSDQSNNTSPFSFNFHISDADEPATQDASSESAYANELGPVSSGSVSDRPRLPFKWIDDEYVKSLMLERSKQALIYSDIPLAYHHGPEEVKCSINELNATRRNEEALDDEVALVGCTELQCPQPHTAIRCVDLSLSSFRTKLSTEESTERIDIVPGIYEGGRQVWECSLDLLQYLVQNNITLQQLYSIRNSNVRNNDDDAPMEETRSRVPSNAFVLELGCGHGLPGIHLVRQALQRGIVSPPDFVVVFTDYNESVLLDATISNTVLNCVSETSDEYERPGVTKSDEVAKRILLGGGDWLDMSHQIRENILDNEVSSSKLPPDGFFDLILAAETIYSTSTARETALLLKRHLRPDTGIAYIASKRYYFGVGGGVDVFRDFCLNTLEDTFPSAAGECQLIVNMVKVIDNGTGNIREILSIQNRSCTS